MRRALVVLLLAGCASRPPIEPMTACRIVKDNRTIIESGTLKDLYEISYGTPARGSVRNAYAQSVFALSLVVVGGVALLGGLVTALATDPATQPGARDAGWAIGGGAFGLGVIGIVLSYTMPSSVRRAREALKSYGEHCRDQP
jgi:hypothetical protein